MPEQENLIETDVLVVGGGAAGCFAAIKAKEQGVDVTLVDKGYVGKSGQTPCCNYTVVFDPKRHDLKSWVERSHRWAQFMDNPEWVEITFKESAARWQDLCSWGLQVYKWDRHGDVFVSPASKDDGEIVSSQLRPGQSERDTPSKSKRYPIRQNAEVMRKQAIKVGVNIMDRITITDLVKQDGRIVGAVGISADSYDFYIFKARATVLCAGAAGLKADGIRSYVTTGDADAMAYRVGCEITGKEWNEMHLVRADFPTWPWSALDRDRFRTFKDDAMYFSRKFNGEGQVITGEYSVGRRPEISGLGDALEVHAGKAPIYWEIITAVPEYLLMLRSPKDLPRKAIDEKASLRGRVRMALARAAGQSYHLSDGIWPVDLNGAAQVPGLYVAGDCLGARPGYPVGGFSQAYCAVTGARAGTAAAGFSRQAEKTEIDKVELERLKEITYTPLERKGGFTPAWVTQIIKNTMFPYWVLFVKHADRLQTALAQIEFLRDNIVPKLTARDPHELRLAHEVRSMTLHAEMKLRASLFRTESRWTHYREDYPRREDPAWLAWIKIKDDNGGMKLTKEPIPEKWWPDLSLPEEERYANPYYPTAEAKPAPEK